MQMLPYVVYYVQSLRSHTVSLQCLDNVYFVYRLTSQDSSQWCAIFCGKVSNNKRCTDWIGLFTALNNSSNNLVLGDPNKGHCCHIRH